MQALAEFCEDLGVALDPIVSAPRFNVALTQPVPVIVSDTRPVLKEMSFGQMLPPRPPDRRGLLVANARAETFLQKPSFREAVAHRRCLLPADGFYEWERAGKARLPHYFYLKGHRPFYLAGLWQPETESTPASVVIVTTTPNEVVKPVHDRMPVILDPASGRAWLGSSPLPPPELERLCRPLPAEMMAEHRVSPRVNQVRYEGADCVAPLTATDPPPSLGLA